ncbi:GNAT family N-acetyltransferase [Halalkalibacterium halodurans]|nr:GNAT family N-acetyltransferase [Halalkalibacterium halodurans]MED4085764.1 GNAT family N-acetyltransferase [Halalkalibacterium halodurans]MED4105630.1 GNAT family N-acetyltransferase [Halalkalibacterium halodurans]MED4107497.1 GNAT family N-acetyltransferase [Halalkalibacterium halodurans]MED4149489.1 GNAT family N-acetyltransferase [Halalkalibacterium halodurans]
MESIRIIEMTDNDWPEVERIYREGIETGNATFETEAPSWEKWDAGHVKSCRFVAKIKEKVVGWVALSPVSSRCVYQGVAEVSVYVGSTGRGKGVGRKLLASVVEESEKQGYWTLQASVFPENVASLKLHRQLGFREVGKRERLAKREGVWRDVILLERRSEKIGL